MPRPPSRRSVSLSPYPRPIWTTSPPGFAFSGPTREDGRNAERTARAWAALMARLGYDQCAVHRNDVGAIISPDPGRTRPGPRPRRPRQPALLLPQRAGREPRGGAGGWVRQVGAACRGHRRSNCRSPPPMSRDGVPVGSPTPGPGMPARSADWNSGHDGHPWTGRLTTSSTLPEAIGCRVHGRDRRHVSHCPSPPHHDQASTCHQETVGGTAYIAGSAVRRRRNRSCHGLLS